MEITKTTASNKALGAARAAKNDEFYTQYADIHAEMNHYRGHFAGKVVYCNCDDPTASNFYKYFRDNFALLKLKKVIAATYRNRSQPNTNCLLQFYYLVRIYV